MSQSQVCSKCQCKDTYQDGSLWICPLCAHEWSSETSGAVESEDLVEDSSVRDANGAVLTDGDSVIVLKELKIKGASSSVKVGTKVKNIRLVESTDGHNIVCKLDGVGTIYLKSEFVRKS